MMPGLFLDLFMYWILTAPCKQTAAIISALHIRELNHCCGSVTQSCLTLCNPIGCSPPGFPILHYLPEFAQTHVHQVSDAIQPSHPLLSPSPVALNLFPASGSFPVSQLFISGGQSIVHSGLVDLHIKGMLSGTLSTLLRNDSFNLQRGCPSLGSSSPQHVKTS